MAKRQTRRSVSVKGITYLRLQAYCATAQPPKSVSSYLEHLIAADLDAKGVATPTSAPPRAPKPQPVPTSDDPVASGIFTF